MTQVVSSVIEAVRGADPLTLAVTFLGLMGLGLIWFAALVVRATTKGKK